MRYQLPLRVGLIGCGRIAHAHLRGYQQLPHMFRVIACCDMNRRVAEAFARQLPDAAVFTDYSEMLDRVDLDAVDITLPHSEHFNAIMAAIRAQQHILVEKPMTLNFLEALQVVNAAQKANVTLMVAQTKRYSAIYQTMKSLLTDGAVGKPLYVRSGVDSLLSDLRPPGDWLFKKSLAGGGVVLSNGVHLIDLLRWLIGEVKAVYAVTKQSPLNPTMDCEDIAACLMEFDDGAIGDLACLYAAKASPWSDAIVWGEFVLVYGTEGILHNIGGEICLISGPKRIRQVFRGFNDDPFRTELEHFGTCLINGCEPLSSGRDNLHTMAVIEAIYRSAGSQRRVTADEVWQGLCPNDNR